jgi:hypothetical protein
MHRTAAQLPKRPHDGNRPEIGELTELLCRLGVLRDSEAVTDHGFNEQ